MIKDTTKAHLALLGANIIYGANYIIAKGVMPDKIGPTAFVFIRLACCVLLFWLIKFLFVKEKVEKKDFLRLALCGLFGGALNQSLFFHGINLTSPIDASIITTATPVIVLVFSYFILKERITKNKIIGITLGAIGAVLLILYGNKAVGTSSFLGNLFILLNACSYGLYLVLAKTLMHKYNVMTVVSWIFLFGFLYVFPFGINAFLETDFSGFDLDTYLTIGYVVIFTTFLAYFFNIYALNHLAPSVTSSYVYLQPAVSFIMVSIMAFVFMQTQYAQDINLVKILSCGLVAFGVYLVSKPQKKKPI
ncbi:DMT family transporter [Aestuariibaculum sp. YM273]|uniref:DMT family transporter n=1 Tax=Aestuariibaculum sp. YM273 TaxID=3070659 RepID=UPI0027DB9B1E|nr:DMT family transporter [Aestuariibaculum sp. YM273]WMI66384.1 DMT family transporter [Aestuariibaculum sp. YM273]